MNAILTSITRTKKGLTILAKSASGKTCQTKPVTFNESEHRETAVRLSEKLGWGNRLIGGETKEGFAYIPVKTTQEKLSTAQLAALVSNECCKLTPSSQDPIRFAMGVETLTKLQDA